MGDLASRIILVLVLGIALLLILIIVWVASYKLIDLMES